MSLSNEEVKKEIGLSLEKIEKGNIQENIILQGFLAMNDIESESLYEKIKSYSTLGKTRRLDLICHKGTYFLSFGFNRDAHPEESFAKDEINYVAEENSRMYDCNHIIFSGDEDMDRFMLESLNNTLMSNIPTTMVYHKKGKKTLSEFASFDGEKVLAGGVANNWGKTLNVEFFGKKSVVNRYKRQFFNCQLESASFGSEFEPATLTRMPLVDKVLTSIQCYKSI